MISAFLQRKASWVAEDGPPNAPTWLQGYADTRWRRVAADVLGRVVDPTSSAVPSSLVLATTRLEEQQRSTPAELEALADAAMIRDRATVFAGADTVAAGFIEAASLAHAHGDACLLFVELTEAAELAAAFRLSSSSGDVRLTVTQGDPLTALPAVTRAHLNPCHAALSLFETNVGQVFRLDTDLRGEFSIKLDSSA